MGGLQLSPDGTQVPIPANLALMGRGPILQVTVSVPQSISEALVQQGIAVAAPITGLALIDTGATATCVDEVAAQKLGVPVVDVTLMHSASHANIPSNRYPIHFDVVGIPMGVDVPTAIGAALESQGLLLLIGRDVLGHCLLVYNGATGAFSLSI